jgi:hypothetical protein
MSKEYMQVVRELLESATLALDTGLAPIADMLIHLGYRTLFNEYENLPQCGEKATLASSMIRFADHHRKMKLEGYL